MKQFENHFPKQTHVLNKTLLLIFQSSPSVYLVHVQQGHVACATAASDL